MIKHKKDSRILIWDLENLPNKGYFFQTYDASIPNQFVQKTHSIISIAYKWYGEDETHVISIADYPKTFAKDPYIDKQVVAEFSKIYNLADYVVAHYGDRHDTPMLHTRLLFNDLPPLKHVQTIDTYKLIKKHFKLNTNKLDHIAFNLGIGSKHSMNAQNWVAIAEGDIDAVKVMADYNKNDVDILEGMFERILPYVQTKINVNHGTGNIHNCPHCGSGTTIKRGYFNNRAGRKLIRQCKDCLHYFNCKVE